MLRDEAGREIILRDTHDHQPLILLKKARAYLASEGMKKQQIDDWVNETKQLGLNGFYQEIERKLSLYIKIMDGRKSR